MSELQEPSFLPKENRSTENIAKAVRSNLDATLSLFPSVPVDEPTLKDVEALEPGTYALHRRPSIAFLWSLPQFKNGTSEVGLLCISKKWLMIVGNEGVTETTPHYTLASIQHDRLFQADLHSHPGDDGAIVTQEQLLTCGTLRGATFPDGTKVPDDQDFPTGWK